MLKLVAEILIGIVIALISFLWVKLDSRVEALEVDAIRMEVNAEKLINVVEDLKEIKADVKDIKSTLFQMNK